MTSTISLFNRTFILCVLLFATLTTLSITNPAAAQTPVMNGFRDFQFGSNTTSEPTGQKPESKLWWNDGFWWGSLFHSASKTFHIYRLDPGTQTWVDQGTKIDDRFYSKADCLWDAANLKLYVASHFFTNTGVPTTDTTKWGRLYRFSYNPVSKIYTLDTGFPVQITRGKSKVLVLAKDSTGMLWVTYIENNTLMVNHSTTSDAAWGTPFVLPVGNTATNLTGNDIGDEIASLIAFAGNQIGLMWSNQKNNSFYFSVHLDGNPDTTWSGPETALPTSNSNAAWADDHINLKTDSTGRIFAAVKTSLSSSTSPLTMLLVRSTSGNWSNYTFGTVSNDHTRPIVVLDEPDNLLYMFASAPSAGGVVYYKTSSMSNISFAAGMGTPVIQSSTDTHIDNVTSMKQNVSSATGIVVLAGDLNTLYYLHNSLSVGTGPPPPPGITSFTPTNGPVGTQVAITGSAFTGTTSVAFNGTVAPGFVINSDTSLSAAVPAGATSGPISVATPNGNASSNSIFIVTTTPSIASFSPSGGGVGTTVTINGASFTGTTNAAFNGTNATSFNVLSDSQLTAVVPTGAATGLISVTNAVGTGTSSSSFTVTTGTGKTLVFAPIGDTYVNSSNVTANYGTSTSLRARQGTTSNPVTYDTFLKFSVTGLLASPVTSATLRLFVTTATTNINNVFATSDSWTETGTTWNNAPAPGAFLGSTGGAAVGTWMEIPLDTSIFRGDGNYDFELTQTGTGYSVVWSSREGTNPPQLVLTQ